MPFTADAAGLGKLTVFSGLGEPLNAEIELSASKEELSSLAARIAPAETYTEQGLDRPVGLSALKLEIGKQANGASIIKLTSAQPVNDPFLDMLIQIEWSTGRLLREYTALLDPPGYGQQKAAAEATPTVSAPAASAAAATTKTVQKGGKARKAAAPATTGTGAPAPEGEGYTTKSGDTLSGVARQLQVEGVSLEQMLAGLYRANKEAFVDGNMNRLKVGQIIRAPDSEELKATSQQDAVKEIRVHTRDWHAYRSKLAGAVAEAAPEGEGAQGRSASGKITAPAEDKAAPTAAGPRDVVKLSKSEPATSKPGAPETAVSKQDRQNASKEEEIARAKAAKEADERLSLLEKQLQDAQKLLQLKNQALADLQKGTPAPTGQAQPPAPVATAQMPTPVTEVKPVEAPKAAEPVAPKQTRKTRRPPPAAEPLPEPGLLDDPLLVGGVGGGLLALLGGGWLYLRNKRRKSLDSFEQGILTSSGLKPNTVFGNTAGGLVDTGDTSFLTDLSQGSGGMIDTNDVDPIAEAEVYMAYGRDVQAEEILKDAITKDPRRYELHQKLLEIYSNRKDTTAFETLAGELYATLGASDANWQKFAAMGHALEPTNPLYSAEVQSVAAVQDKVAATQELSSAAFNAPVQAAPPSLGSSEGTPLSLEQDTVLEFSEPAAATDNSLDFDLGITADSAQEPALQQEPVEEKAKLPEIAVENQAEVATAPAAAGVSDDNSLEFSFELPEPASRGNVQLGVEDIGLKPEPSAEFQDTVLETFPELSAVEPAVAAGANAEPVVEDISLEFPELDLNAADQSTPAASAPVVAPLDLPEEAAVAVAAPENVAAADEHTLPEISETAFDLPAETTAGATETSLPPLQPESEAVAEEIVFETAPEDASALDFDFALETGDTSETEPEPEQVPALGLPDLNLSGISLDLDEPAAKVAESPAVSSAADEIPEAAQAVEEITFSTDESADVDTKLDLVAAYTDMGDTEGARELLEEVLREGGPQQRARAQSMLDTLG